MYIYIFLICSMFGKIHTHIMFVAILAAVSAVSQSTKQVTRMGMELHLQSNSFQIKKIQVLHLLLLLMFKCHKF